VDRVSVAAENRLEIGPMASRPTPRWRHTAAQLHALEQVQREIHATDPHLRRKYLRDFNSAFRTYDAVLMPAELDDIYLAADVLLVGDYHSLPASQDFATDLLRRLSRAGRKIVLGVEFVFAHNQPALNAWSAGRIDGSELRRRIRFDSEWGYGWRPFYRLLQAGRGFADRIVALDHMPRNDLSRIGERDRHAASRLASIRQQHPDAVIVALFGESHLAPNHLPELLRRRRPADHIVTVLQNIDPLYWRASGESPQRLDAVRVSPDVVCVFNSTPLEKYASYHLCIQRWQHGHVRSRADTRTDARS
jgi:hypothetical protein